MTGEQPGGQLRWRLAEEEDGGQQRLFEEPTGWHAGHGEFRGLEFLHVRAKRIINEVPSASHMPFRYTINAYRGCSHACAYCMVGDTQVLMGDGRTRPLSEIRAGDRIYGTIREGRYRRYVITSVWNRWQTVKPAYRVTLEDGTEIVASGDHRFWTHRGKWKHIVGSEQGLFRRPHLTLNDQLAGLGKFARPPEHDEDFQYGYLCGMIRGDGLLRSHTYARPNGRNWTSNQFRLALTDLEGLHRAKAFLAGVGVGTRDFLFQEAVDMRKAVHAIRTSSVAGVTAVREAIRWPLRPSDSWVKGFLAGIFDAEGSYSGGILRIANTDEAIVQHVTGSLKRFGFSFVVDTTKNSNGLVYVRVTGGVREHLRFFHTVDPAITRRRSVAGMALKCDAHLRVVAIEPLGVDLPMYDITTGTGDFIANGVVSHNCFARPTHEYLNLNAGEDFERKIVVKINAVERLRAELGAPSWTGDAIAMGTNTDPYQRCEGKYRLTRGIVEVLGEAANPFSILTKSTLILRDLDVLAEAARRTEVRANLSIGTLDEEVWRASEPGTPHPRRRVEAVTRLNEAGIPTGVLVAPILPGLSDAPDQLEAVTRACVEAGAVSITPIVLHLRPGVREQYMPWLEQLRPDLVPTYQRLYPRSYAPKAYQEEVSARVQRERGY